MERSAHVEAPHDFRYGYGIWLDTAKEHS
jgi:hypothetical protein